MPNSSATTHRAARHALDAACATRTGTAARRSTAARWQASSGHDISVAAKLARHRRGRPAQLVGDVAHTDTRTVQVSDRRPLGQRQIPGMLCFGGCKRHRRIVHRLTGRVADGAPVAPACSRPAADSHDPARLGVTHPLPDQPNRTIPAFPPASHHAASSAQLPSQPPHSLGVATFTGIRLPRLLPDVTFDTALSRISFRAGVPNDPHRPEEVW